MTAPLLNPKLDTLTALVSSAGQGAFCTGGCSKTEKTDRPSTFNTASEWRAYG